MEIKKVAVIGIGTVGVWLGRFIGGWERMGRGSRLCYG